MKHSSKHSRTAKTGALTPVIILALAFGLWTCGKSNEGDGKNNTTGQKAEARIGIVFLGDSLTAGRGLPFESAMPARIQKQIDASGLKYRVINGGRSGDTTAGGVSRLAWYLRPEVNAQYLIIGLGSNDAMRGRSISSMKQNLRTIIKRARAYNPKMKIFLFQMHTFPNMGRSYAGAYRKLFRQVAKSERITLLPFPLAGVAGMPAMNQPDGIHPNDAGTAIFARNVWRALKPHL